MSPILSIHPAASQPFTSGYNIGERQVSRQGNRYPLPLTVTMRSALPKFTIRSNSAAHFFGRDSGGTNPLAR
jgi:hypothetical protein